MKIARGILSMIIAGLFMVYGFGIILSVNPGMTSAQWGFAVVSIAYGLSSLVILGWAVSKKPRGSSLAAACAATIYLIAWIVGSLDSGIISGFEWIAIILVGCVLAVNWKTIESVANKSRA